LPVFVCLAVCLSVSKITPQCHLPTQLEDVPVSTILGALSVLEALCDYALYKSTFTFTFTQKRVHGFG